MVSKELRIGNYTSKGVVYQIEEDCFYTSTDGVSYKNKWAKIHPIPLTPEILKINKFVFDIATGTYWLNMSTHYLELLPAGGYWWPTYASIPEMSSESEQRVSTCRIQSVHQLQNLYFALTGEELEVNLT